MALRTIAARLRLRNLTCVGACLCVLLLLTPGTAPFSYPSIEKNLTQTLLNKYQEYGILGRPVSTSTELMTVQYGLQLIQILDLDENKQILRTNCWPMYRWEDPLLKWNPEDYAGITELRVFPDQIWTPDIKLYNFADERLKEARVARVVVSSNGGTLWLPQSIFKSTCSVEIIYFPFDTQICMLEFGSWTHDINQLDIQWWVPDNATESSPYISFSDYIKSPEWKTDGEEEKGEIKNQIKSVKKIRERFYVDARGERIKRSYPVLRYLVKLRRNSSFYASILVFPCILLSSLTLVVFWLPPESPAKMMLGMNIFVAFFILLLLLAESIPSAVKRFPLIGAYFCLNMIMITLSTFLATIVINLYTRGDSAGPVPRTLRHIMIEGLGRLLLVRQHIPIQEEPRISQKVITRTGNGNIRKCHLNIPNLKFNKFLTSVQHPENMAPETQFQCNSMPYQMSKDEEGTIWQTNVQHHPALYCRSSTNCDHPTVPVRPYPITDTEDSPLLMHCHTTLERNVRELKHYIRIFVNRQKENSRKNMISLEWRTLAMVLDRLFFVLYICTIAIAVIACIPKTTEPEIPEAYRD